MIPSKVFFESLTTTPQTNQKLQFHILVNGLHYQRIKLFQQAYVCLSVNDLISIEMIPRDRKQKKTDKQNQNSEKTEPTRLTYSNKKQPEKVSKSHKKQLDWHENFKKETLRVDIPNGYRLSLQSQTIEVKFIREMGHTVTKFLFQPVSAFSPLRLVQNKDQNSIHASLLEHNHSFEPLFSDTLKKKNVTKGAQDIQKSHIQEYNNSREAERFHYPLLNSSEIELKIRNCKVEGKDSEQDGDKSRENSIALRPSQEATLQSLALQRDKILGQLYGKLKVV